MTWQSRAAASATWSTSNDDTGTWSNAVATWGDDVYFAGNITVNGNATVAGDLTVAGTATFADVTFTMPTFSGDMSVIGNATISGDIAVGGDAAITGVISVGGAATFSDDIAVSGDAAIAGGTLTVGASALAATAHFILNAAAGFFRGIRYRTADVERWFAGASSTTESGSNAGSNFILQAFSDAGATIDIPLQINRTSTGTIYLGSSGVRGVLIGTTTDTNIWGGDVRLGNNLWIKDPGVAPSTTTGFACIYIDSADGDLKVRFADGVTKTLVTDT